jgi:phage shock protein PspC (stress-responsive transcriptional regulator)
VLLAIFFAGTGVLVYLVLWIALPLAPIDVPMTVQTTTARV